jgi:uncharacterized glyoxalase superfamily protein PhnB
MRKLSVLTLGVSNLERSIRFNPPDGMGFSGIPLAQNVGSSAEVSEVLQRAVSAEGTLIKSGQPVFWGGFSGYFADPDGYLWEIACDSETYLKEIATT